MKSEVVVCIYSSTENIWGGGQVYNENLCRYLNESGLPSAIATSEPETYRCSTLRLDSISSRFARLRDSPALAVRLKRLGVEIVVLDDLSALWLAPVFRIFGFKVLSLLHLNLQRRNVNGFGHRYVEYHWLRFSSLFAHRVISVNTDNISVFPTKVEFVGNFISPWFFAQPNTEGKDFDVGLIARLAPVKNIPLFVELVARLNEISERPIRGLVVGSGEEQLWLEQELDRRRMREIIEVRPWVDRHDLPSVFDSIKCFAVTSHHEGFPTTVLECHARGVPVISTKSAGYIPQFLRGIGPKTGLSFTPEDLGSEEIIQDALNLIENHTEYRDHCIEKASMFSEERVLGRIKQIIQSLVF